MNTPRFLTTLFPFLLLASPAPADGLPLKPGEQSKTVLLECDFESQDWFKSWGLKSKPQNTEIISADPKQKFEPLRGSALRITIDQGDHYGTSVEYRFKRQHGGEPEEIYFRNRWYCIEQFVKLNTPGKADGVMRGWVDGQPAFEKTDVRMRAADTLKIEMVWLNVYYGGTWVAPSDMHVFVDDVVISQKPIGPARVPASSSRSAPLF